MGGVMGGDVYVNERMNEVMESIVWHCVAFGWNTRIFE
jgi:hypothetical protein